MFKRSFSVFQNYQSLLNLTINLNEHYILILKALKEENKTFVYERMFCCLSVDQLCKKIFNFISPNSLKAIRYHFLVSVVQGSG